MKKIFSVGLISYGVFAGVLLLGRWFLDSRAIDHWPSSWIGTLGIWVGAILFYISLLGPAVITILLVRRCWPGVTWRAVFLSWIPAAVASAVIAPLFWSILFEAGFSLRDFFSAPAWTILLSASWWLAGTLFVVSLDHFMLRPKKQPVRPS